MAIAIFYLALLIDSDLKRENDDFVFIHHVNRSMNFLLQRH